MTTADLTLFRSRRTIRRFATQDVSEEEIEQLLEAASVAPSRLDRRPLHYVVIRNAMIKAKIAEALRVRPYIEEASVVLAICADPVVSPTWELDGSAAIENILLAATAMGLGAAWVGSKGSQLWEQALGILHQVVSVPAGIAVVSLVCIGHPAESKDPYEAGEKLDPRRIHYDHWDTLKL